LLVLARASGSAVTLTLFAQWTFFCRA